MRYLIRIFFIVSMIYTQLSYANPVAIQNDFPKLRTTEENWIHTSQQIAKTLLDSNAQSAISVFSKILVEPNAFPNSFVNKENLLTISSGLLEHINSSDELTFIIAHELGHIILGHTAMNTPASINELIHREIEADSFALGLLKNQKYDTKAGLNVLQKIGAFKIDEDGATLKETFPSLKPRIRYLSMLQ